MYYDNFARLCEINNVKPSKVSKETGISTATLTSWKQGKYTPKQDKLQLIADYFHVSVDFIMTGEDNRIDAPVFEKEHIELITLYSQLEKEQKDAVFNLLRSFCYK